MRRLALVAFVSVLSFWFAGCAGSFKKPWSLPDPDQATVVDSWSDYEAHEGKSVEFYVVVFEHNERFAKVRVEKSAFEAVHEGDKAKIELMSVTLTQDDRYLLETEYLWKAEGKEYPVIFKSGAKERPVRPVPSADKS